VRQRDPEAAWRACANITAPTLIIRGALSDVLSPEVAARMLEVMPDARLTQVDNSGHSVPLDAPEAFLAAARAFLKGRVEVPA
jgi:pimeloyl-ACP methyl ester carboxylesterase